MASASSLVGMGHYTGGTGFELCNHNRIDMYAPVRVGIQDPHPNTHTRSRPTLLPLRQLTAGVIVSLLGGGHGFSGRHRCVSLPQL